MKSDEDLFLLGGASFHPDQTVSHDLVLPEQVVYALIVEPKADVFWAVDDETEVGAVCLSKHRDWFEGEDRFILVGRSFVDADRAIQVPGELVEDRTVLDWQQGEPMYFIAFAEDKLAMACRMVPENELWTWFDAVAVKSV